MSARKVYDALDEKAPPGKLKHHGNKRKLVATLKVKARRADRRVKKSTLED